MTLVPPITMAWYNGMSHLKSEGFRTDILLILFDTLQLGLQLADCSADSDQSCTFQCFIRMGNHKYNQCICDSPGFIVGFIGKYMSPNISCLYDGIGTPV